MNWVKFKSSASFLILVAGIAFGLNWIWEMLQMPAFAGVSDRPRKEMLYLCTKAAGGDAGVTLSCYLILALATGSLHWAKQLKSNIYLAAGILGLC